MNTCPICNKPVKSGNIYCSIQCQHQSMKVFNYYPMKIPVCKCCDKPLTHNQLRNNGKFCSSYCYRQYNRNQKLNSATKNCLICNKPLTTKQMLAGTCTCSAKCAYHWRVQRYGEASEANPNKYVQYSTTNALRHDSNYIDKCSKELKQRWQQSEFRQGVIKRMTEHNPSQVPEIQRKIRHSKEAHGILHTFTGIRGGNSHISSAEQVLYSFCIDNGFLYNYAINTYALRLQYPDEHYGFNYKPDFVHLPAKLCIEIDGNSHNVKEQKLLDVKKEKCLSLLGYKTIRFCNKDVLENTQDVKAKILQSLHLIMKEMEDVNEVIKE